MKRGIFFALVILTIIAAFAHSSNVPVAYAAGESIDKWVIASGGGVSNGGNIVIQDTIGQPIIGTANGTATWWNDGFWYQVYKPTAVTLASFAATSQDGALLIRWSTATEINNLGFNLYRAISPVGMRTKLNASLIPSQNLGGVTGATYTYTDQNVLAGKTYYYWLELVSTSGTSTLTGPVTGSTLNSIFLPLVNR